MEFRLLDCRLFDFVSKDLGFLLPEACAAPLSEISEIARMRNALRLKVEQGKRK